jgi:hypothetical protein
MIVWLLYVVIKKLNKKKFMNILTIFLYLRVKFRDGVLFFLLLFVWPQTWNEECRWYPSGHRGKEDNKKNQFFLHKIKKHA